jgi:hypothetical protein
MAKKGVLKYISFMLLLISTLIAVFTLFGLCGGMIDPARGTAMAMLVYILPFLLGGNVLTAIYWIARRRWHWLVIPAIPLLFSIPYIGTNYQPGFFHDGETDHSGIKVATYNVALFGRETSGFKALDILAEKKRENVDNFVDRAVDVKLTAALKGIVKLNEKEVTLEDFNKMMREA